MIGAATPGTKRITPSAFHVPPRPFGTSATTSGVPPAMSVRFNFPSAKNAMLCPSGAQNGRLAP